jgi:predicted nuclease of predicted toxin-antitoxin system
MTFLIDECLHTSLVSVAQEQKHEAHHVVYLGMQGWKDHDVLRRVEERDFTLVTNNAVDFRRLYARVAIHAGLVIVIPNVVPSLQRELLRAVLDHVGDRGLLNTVIEVGIEDGQIAIVEYKLPADK